MTTQIQLAVWAQWLLIVAAYVARIGRATGTGIRIPHSWVVAVTNRSWRRRMGSGPWHAIRIDNAGRIIA